MTTLMVIGGSGFFGKSILDAYQRGILESWKIDGVIVVSRSASNLKNTHPYLIGESITLVDDDISLCTSLPYADFVIHAAASTDAAHYLCKPLEGGKNIELATLNYCNLAKNYHKESKIVYCSSGAVYGQQSALLVGLDEDAEFGLIENLPSGKREYAQAKRNAEMEIRRLGLQGANISIARCFAFVGKYLRRDQHFAIGNFIEDGLNQRPICVNAKHLVFRSYMYADDLVVWLMTIAAHANTDCEIFNVGSDEAVDLGELAKNIADFFGVQAKVPIREGAMIDRYIPSIEKARNKLGLDINYGLRGAILATIQGIV
ncbi:NAD(P)-dependent oxidoreductase [Polynucleobacter paneuropaeus]|nr:NAD(P)-dependent oxidoreductase [Polynucleobacter paneuropaeus]